MAFDLWSELLIEQFSLKLKSVFEKKNVVIKILQQQKKNFQSASQAFDLLWTQ